MSIVHKTGSNRAWNRQDGLPRHFIGSYRRLSGSPSDHVNPAIHAVDTVVVLATIAFCVLAVSPLPIISLMPIPLFARLLWTAKLPPIFLPCLLMQWLYVNSNYFYFLVCGRYPKDAAYENLPAVLTVSSFGLMIMAVGFSLSYHGAVRAWGVRLQSATASDAQMRKLALLCLLWSVAAFLAEPHFPLLISGLSTLLRAFFSFRLVLFVLIAILVFRKMRGFGLLAGLTAVIVILSFASPQSFFKEIVFMCLVGAACGCSASIRTVFERRRFSAVVVTTAVAFVGLFFVGVLWESQIKQHWRTRQVPDSQAQRLQEFFSVAARQLGEVDFRSGTEDLFARMNNMWQMDLAFSRVPSLVAHTNGQLTVRAITHVLQPRILFPQKADLGSDSWLAERILGTEVGHNTSVGIGYQTEFYVDYGIPGNFVVLFILGAFLGLFALMVIRCSPTVDLGVAIAVVILWGSFSNFEAHFTKALGGLISYGLVALALAYVLPGGCLAKGRSHIKAGLRSRLR